MGENGSWKKGLRFAVLYVVKVTDSRIANIDLFQYHAWYQYQYGSGPVQQFIQMLTENRIHWILSNEQ